ncbi:MAG: hypothetical protein ACRDIX_06680 [Actinomycetota bacterium]
MSDEQRDPAAELFEHRDDAGEWSEEPEEIEVRPSPSEVVSFRVPSGEFDLLEDAARNAGESISEYIRKALALRLHGTPIGPTIEITSGAERLLVRSHIVTGGYREAPSSIVQDFPPMQVANL